MFMAGSASDDGSGVWTSKAHMAADLEISKRTIQRSTDSLLAKGIISQVGYKKCKNGFTVEYQINLPICQNLPSTRKDNENTGVTMSPQEVTQCHPNRTGTVKEPIAPQDGAQNLDIDLQNNSKASMSQNETRLSQSGISSQVTQGHGMGMGKNHVSNWGMDDLCQEFLLAYPKPGNPDRVAAALEKALALGVDAETILNGAKAYATEQKGNAPKFIAYPENWIAKARWASVATTAKAQRATPDEVAANYARMITGGKKFAANVVSPAMARDLIKRALVTEQQCKSVGVSF